MFRRFRALLRRPEPFNRPNSGLARAANWFLPPSPRRQVVLYRDDLKAYCRPWYYVLSMLMLAMFHLLRIGQERVWRGSRYSPVSFSFAVLVWLQRALSRKSPTFVRLQHHGLKFFNVLPKVASTNVVSRMAIVEEQWFREGAESWTPKQRLISCLSFGFVHQGNLLYSLSTILPLSVIGAIFMAVYLHTFRRTGNRRDAVLAAAALHRTYNHSAYTLSGLAALYTVIAKQMRSKAQTRKATLEQR